MKTVKRQFFLFTYVPSIPTILLYSVAESELGEYVIYFPEVT